MSTTESSLGACALPPPYKAKSDRRRYQQLKLANGLEAIIIHDPETDTAAASLDVSIGSLQDPHHRQGLAHFLEHLLFMGTEKYPDEAEYQMYLSEHGGSTNAYTDDEHTNYFFDVQWTALEDALDRFAHFFRTPLFDASCTDRERDAVHAEHMKNVRDDEWRREQLIRHLVPAGHPLFNTFGTGTKETLKGDAVREDVIEFYRRHYIPRRMRLVVLGRHSLEEMAGWVVERFSPIVDQSINSAESDTQNDVSETSYRPFVSACSLGGNRKQGLAIGRVTVQQCLKSIQRLEFIWFTRPMVSHRSTRPLDLLAEILGDEQKGSLMAYLRTHALATHSLGIECSHSEAFSTFRIFIDVTEAGRREWKRIAALVFKWIAFVPNILFTTERWKEVSEEQQLAFDYGDVSDPTTMVHELSREMHRYPPEERIRGPHLFQQIPSDTLIIELVKEDLSPEFCHLIVMESGAHICEPLGSQEDLGLDVVGPQVSRTEPWYGTRFVTRTEVEIEEKEGDECFASPASNIYLPTSLKVVGSRKAGEWSVPHMLTPGLYFKQDDLFGLPKGIAILFFGHPRRLSADEMIKEKLRITMLTEQLAQDLYAATNAGIEHEVELKSTGILIMVSGFSSKLILVVEECCRRICTSFDIHPWAVERVRRELQSVARDPPYKQARQLLGQLLQPGIYGPDTLLTALDAYYSSKGTHATEDQKNEIEDTLKSIEPIKCYSSGVEVDCLVHGNFEAAEATAIFEAALKLGNGIPGGLRPLHVPIRELRPGCPVVVAREQTSDAANCIHVLFQFGVITNDGYKEYAMALLIAQIITEPFFDQLRTKEQLGYFVRAQMRFDGRGFGLELVLQSHRSAAYLWERICVFLQGFSSTLLSMGKSELERHHQALHHRLTERPSKLRSETMPYWAAIYRHDLIFDLFKKTASVIHGIDRSTMVKYYKEKVLCEETRQMAIVAVEQGACSLNMENAFQILLKPGDTKALEEFNSKR